MRDLAVRFNSRFGETFPVPEAVIGRQGARIMSLDDPTQKMSKSAERPGSTLGMLDPPDVVRSKLARAVTDSGREIRYGPEKPAISNLLDILGGVTGRSPTDLEAGYEGQGDARPKAGAAGAGVSVLEPFQRRSAEPISHPPMLDKLLAEGARAAPPG